MGLDVLELVLEVEKTFSITVDERDGPTLATVGDLHRYVLERLGPEDRAGCLSNVAFYRLRRALTDTFGFDRARVRPETSVETLLPRGSRPDDWRRLRASLGLTLPALERPGWVYHVVLPAWVVGILTTAYLLVILVIDREGLFYNREPLVATAVVGFLVAVGVELATRRLERLLPPGCESVRGLVEALVSLNFARLLSSQRRWTRDDVWTTVRGLVARQFQLPPDEVTESTRFVQDLGA